MTSTPPSGPPHSGPPPSGPPPGAEYLDSASSSPDRPARTGGGSRRTAVVAGAGVLAVVLLGGGVWAATSFFATGDQPAQALPDSTLAYLSVDLDPSGSQKIAALQTLKKFPAFEDQVGLQTDDDLRKKAVEYVLDQSGCDVSYDETVAPWLGNRFAVAAVDLGEDAPTPVVVAQVTDAGAAETGLGSLSDCSESGTSGFAVEGDWAVLAETDALAEEVLTQTAEATLADDSDFQRWTGTTGDAGFMTGYAAPGVGPVAAESLGALTALGSVGPADAGTDTTSELTSSLEDFQGAALTVRFADGSVELETAADSAVGGVPALTGSDQGGQAMATLPEDTAAAFGLGFEPGWFSAVLDYVGQYGGPSTEELNQQIEETTGLTVPEDPETLFGDSAVISLGSDIDPSAFTASEDGSAIPVALKVHGDAAGIEDVLDTLRSQPDLAGSAGTFLDSDAEGDFVVIGPNPDYRQQIAGDGGLGGNDVFTGVVSEADRASAVLFVNFDAGDGWAEKLAGDDQSLSENLAPLSGLGVSAWLEGDVSHATMKITTE